ncbi:hypothetical protein PsorP6_001763 [Peronosclerospora sorghi]|uniref:Uncharacterized protein n=1 Tax=Peronosclerospora sorghi TaxID=230839 RepID=A0ACC0WVY8_9STRA|nr:hypothetical protein PsorP6_001763 [Peronosclerospora sorghi]
MRIPASRRLNAEDNADLLMSITEEEIHMAIKGIERRKAGGSDGLNNDFYTDFELEVTPALLRTVNDIMKGGGNSGILFTSTHHSIEKKGDSANAMDYRPISLLQTSYMIFTKVLAMRLQKFLGRLIGDTQQGFVYLQKMDKSVVMMLELLRTKSTTTPQSLAECGGILLLDFAKVYDTLDRCYLFAVLEKFGLAERFISLIKRIHTGTTASMQVNSGIHQGCPLSPLIFILVEEPLGLALVQNHQVGRAMEMVKFFGTVSGLYIQPSKCQYIFLTQTEVCKKWFGIPVLEQNVTTRYLGHQVGVQPLAHTNWAVRIIAIKRRVITATNCGTSVIERIQVFNAVIIPAILLQRKCFRRHQQY